MKTTLLRTSFLFFLISLFLSPALLAQQEQLHLEKQQHKTLPRQAEAKRQVMQALHILKSQIALHPEALQMRSTSAAKHTPDDSSSAGAIAGQIAGIAEGDSAWVLAIAAHLFEDPTAWRFGEVGPDGEYTIPGLNTGIYIVMAGADGYLPQFFSHAYEVWGAVPVEVGPHEVTGGIDFFLEPSQSGAGSISGRVLAEDTMEPVSRAQVYIFNATNPFISVWTETNDDGTYQMDNLRSGSYYVQVVARDYFIQYYDRVSTFEEATAVTIADGETTAGIDFLLNKGGTISGTVRDAMGNPIAGASVQGYALTDRGYDDHYGYGWTQTDENGDFTLSGLNTGDYIVSVHHYTHYYSVTEWYDDAASEQDATPVSVMLGENTAGIDFVIDTPTEFGSIAGTLTTEDGAPLTSGIVRLESVETPNFYYYSHAYPDEAGAYVIEKVPVGSYRVVLEYWSMWYYDVLWYDQAETPEAATLVAVEADAQVQGIDFVTPVADGVIAGVVTNIEGKPIANASIQLNNMYPGHFYEDGAPVWAYATTDSEGRYRIEGLPDGEYFVSAFFCYFYECTQQWWPGVEYQERAEPVVIADGQSIPASVDFELPIEMGDASLSGTVTNLDGEPLAGATLSLSPFMTATDSVGVDPDYGWVSELQIVTDETGNYTFNYLPAGTYALYAAYWEEGAFGSAWYKNAATLSDATPIDIGENDALSGYDFSLDVRSYLGSVAGTVTLEDGAPIERAYVEINGYFYPEYDRDLAIYAAEWYTLTDAAGNFQIDGLYEGEYMIAVYAQGAIRNPSADSTGANLLRVKVIGGEISMVDISMTAQDDGASEIGGSIASEQGEVLEVAIVKAIPVTDSGAAYYTAIADDNGVYRLEGLPEGEYYVQARAPWHITEYYREAFDPAEADLVSTQQNLPAEGIDFTLDPFYFYDFAVADAAGERGLSNQTSTLYGTVTSDTGTPLVGATVYVVDESGQPLLSAETFEGGQYELAGIQPGLNYRIKASHAGYESQYNGAASDAASAPGFTMNSGSYEINFTLRKSSTSVGKEDAPELPGRLELLGNYPNPFNAETRISFSIPRAEHVSIEIFDALGRRIETLQDGLLQAGTHTLRWEQTSDAQPSGLYFYRITSGSETVAGSMTLMK